MRDLITIRKASPANKGAIRSLVFRGGINPSGLDWHRFVVASLQDGEVVGCGQIKPHRDGSLEVASIVVKPAWRRRGIARSIIAHLVSSQDVNLYLMCRSGLKRLYEECGFRIIEEDEMPRYFRKITRLARFADSLRREGETLLVMKRDKDN